MPSLRYEEVMNWSASDVADWLQKNNYKEFANFVVTQQIDGYTFARLNKQRLESCKEAKNSKKESLLKVTKALEKEANKLQKSGKLKPKDPAAPVSRSLPPAVNHEDEFEVEYIYDDDEEWEEQDVYDNEDIFQPPKIEPRKQSHETVKIKTESEDDEDYCVPDKGDEQLFYETHIGEEAEPSAEFKPSLPPSRNEHAPMPPVGLPPRNSPSTNTRTVPPVPTSPSQPSPGETRQPVQPPRNEHQTAKAGSSRPPLPRPESTDAWYEETPTCDPPPRSSPATSSAQKGTRAPPPPIPPVEEYPEVKIEEQPDYETCENPEEETEQHVKVHVEPVAPLPPRSRRDVPVPVPHPTCPTPPIHVPPTPEIGLIRKEPKIEPPIGGRGAPPPRPTSDIYEDADKFSEIQEPPAPKSARTAPQPPLPTLGGDSRSDVAANKCSSAGYSESSHHVRSQRAHAPSPPPHEQALYEETELYPVASQNQVRPLASQSQQRPLASQSHQRPPAPIPPPQPQEIHEETQDPPPPPLQKREQKKGNRPPAPLPGEASNDRKTENGTVTMEHEIHTDEVHRDDFEEDENGNFETTDMVKPNVSKAIGQRGPGVAMESIIIRKAKDNLRKVAIPNYTDVDPVKKSNNRSHDEAVKEDNLPQTKPSKSKAPAPSPAKTKTNTRPPAAAAAAAPSPSPSNESKAPGGPELPRRSREHVSDNIPPGAPDSNTGPMAPVADRHQAPNSNDINAQPWYFKNLGREEAKTMITKTKDDGTYLVRDSERSGQPYTLCLLFKGDIFNIAIRKRPDGKFALGTEKSEEHVFDTVIDMVKFHGNNAIEVSKGSKTGKVKLMKIAS